MSARAQCLTSLPDLGPRFGELVAVLRNARSVAPADVAGSLLAVADCEAHEARRNVSAADLASATALAALPEAPLPLPAALLLCMGPDGYLTAAAQSALLETHAGARACQSSSGSTGVGR